MLVMPTLFLFADLAVPRREPVQAGGPDDQRERHRNGADGRVTAGEGEQAGHQGDNPKDDADQSWCVPAVFHRLAGMLAGGAGVIDRGRAESLLDSVEVRQLQLPAGV